MIDLRLGDCIPIMSTLSGPYDMILADLPYGTTACKWDTVIPFKPLWEQYKRLIKRKGAVVLFGSQPFTSALVMSNAEWFKYCWVWIKNYATGHANVKRQPMRSHENLCVFYDGQCTYNPQPTHSIITDRSINGALQGKSEKRSEHHPGLEHRNHPLREWVYPKSYLEFGTVPRATGTLHPTQKPVALLEYLIRTYTNEGETVLDNTMGSGPTGVACVNTGRSFVGIEMDAGYFEIAETRIQAAQAEMVQLSLEKEA